ncbi:MAG: hypothetical protein ABIR91_00695 [Candidatus Saccharimonadales bacterium]
MNSFKVMEYRVSYIVAAAALLFAVMVPAIVAAASVTERSIELTSSSISATNVTYKVNFTPAATAGAFVVDFCSNSPVIGETCTAPTGFDSSAAGSTTSGFTDVSATTAQPAKTSQLVVTGSMTASTPVSV